MRSLKYWLLCGAALIAAIWAVGAPQPAQAQFGFGFRGVPFNIYIGPGHRRHGGRNRNRGGSQEERDDTPNLPPRRPRRFFASLGAPSSAEQSRMLKGINASPVLGVVGSTKDLQDVGKPQSKEDDRDYTGALDLVVTRLSRSQDKGLSTAGDATASGIEQALIKAIKDARLDEFERFASESWTTDRIRKLVLDRVYNDLDPLLKGNTRGQVRMEAIEPCDPACRPSDLSAHFRDVRAACDEPRRQPVHPESLSKDRRIRSTIARARSPTASCGADRTAMLARYDGS